MDEKLTEVVEKAMTGDQEAFAELCRMKGKDILYISMSLLEKTSEAEDATQEIFIYMQQHITELRNAAAFQVWLYRIIKGICLNMNRKNKRVIMTFSEEDVGMTEDRQDKLPQEFLEDSRKRELMLQVINELPGRYKLCVLMYYYEGMHYKDIEKALHINKKQVDHALSRARKKLKKRLENEQNGEQFLASFVPVSIPVVAKALRADIGQAIPDTKIEQILQESMVVVTKVGAVGLAEAVNEAGWQITGRSASAVTKITIGTIVTTGVVAVGVQTLTSETEVVDPLPAEIVEEQQPEVATEALPLPEQPEEKVINTLEDMIGDAAAERLRSLTVKSSETREVLQFLEQIETVRTESIYYPVTDKEYTLFVLEKRNKVLMIIISVPVEGDQAEVAYQMEEAGTQLPKDSEIIFSADGWK